MRKELKTDGDHLRTQEGMYILDQIIQTGEGEISFRKGSTVVVINLDYDFISLDILTRKEISSCEVDSEVTYCCCPEGTKINKVKVKFE